MNRYVAYIIAPVVGGRSAYHCVRDARMMFPSVVDE